MTTKILPLYQCHKKVRAAKITGHFTEWDTNKMNMMAVLVTDFGPFVLPFKDDVSYEDGGYVVQYEDGYTSYSPAKAFEDGYTLTEGTET